LFSIKLIQRGNYIYRERERDDEDGELSSCYLEGTNIEFNFNFLFFNINEIIYNIEKIEAENEKNLHCSNFKSIKRHLDLLNKSNIGLISMCGVVLYCCVFWLGYPSLIVLKYNFFSVVCRKYLQQ